MGSSPAQAQTTTYTYGDAQHPGDLTAVTDPDGKQWTYGYDGSGDVVRATDPLGDSTTTGYNAVGWRTSVVSPRGNVSGCGCASQYTTSYDYTDLRLGGTDGFGDMGTVTDPLGHTTQRTYDANRNLTAAKDGTASSPSAPTTMPPADRRPARAPRPSSSATPWRAATPR